MSEKRTFLCGFSDTGHEKSRPGLADALTEPNNMLGFQYVSAIRRRRLPLSVITVRRDAAHPVSATAMREMICSGRIAVIRMPGFSASEAVSLVQSGRYTDYRRYEDACLLTGRQKNAAELGGTGLFSEGWKTDGPLHGGAFLSGGAEPD